MAIVEVIKYNGTPDTFAWKYPSEELGTWTQLIVNESQEAVFLKGGQICDIFSSGTYTLETRNIPILNNIINLPFGGRSPFAAEVWYINKACTLDVKWGTPTPIQLQDPKYNLFVSVRSFGQFGIRINDSSIFLRKLVGTLPAFNKEDIINFFKGLYLTKIKDSISSYLVHKKISVLEINAYLDEISQFMKERIEDELLHYGIELVNFYVNDISVPEDDPNIKKLQNALAKKAEMDIVGYNYEQERSFDTLESAASNPGAASSGFMGAGMGLGMGVSLGGAFGSSMIDVSENMNTKNTINCPKCGCKISNDKNFCPDCGFVLNENKEVKSIKCSKCGSIIDVGMKFCPECGDIYNPCPKCGADVVIGSDICPECGYNYPPKCPVCGKDTIENAKFCPSCGQSLVKKCTKCGSEVKSDVNFCPECGEKLK